MESTVASLLTPGKGILAADESLGTIGKRFEALDIPSTEPNRRNYRELLFSAPGLNEFISGVILFDETIRQCAKDNAPLPELLAKQGIVPGIKVDKGAISLVNFADEKITQGLDDLRQRLEEYRELGARFTKWRAVIAISETAPSQACIQANASALALFAGLSQEAGLVPIVEPEVLMDGNHTLARCEDITTVVLQTVFAALAEQRVTFETMLLKTGMVLSGSDCPEQADHALVAEATLRCLRRAVPPAVPGIVFLSGGQSDVAATQNLDAICRGNLGPWRLSFSFGRALQSSALGFWKGSPENLVAAQDALALRARCNGAAIQGEYSAAMETSHL